MQAGQMTQWTGWLRKRPHHVHMDPPQTLSKSQPKTLCILKRHKLIKLNAEQWTSPCEEKKTNPNWPSVLFDSDGGWWLLLWSLVSNSTLTESEDLGASGLLGTSPAFRGTPGFLPTGGGARGFFGPATGVGFSATASERATWGLNNTHTDIQHSKSLT